MYYKNELQKEGKIDFDDMILESSDKLDYTHNFNYKVFEKTVLRVLKEICKNYSDKKKLEEIAKKSIYDYLENTLNVKIMTSKRKMTAELATSEDKKYLELEDYNCLAIVSGRVFNSDGIQFEYTESRHRPDYFCFEDIVLNLSSPVITGFLTSLLTNENKSNEFLMLLLHE